MLKTIKTKTTGDPTTLGIILTISEHKGTNHTRQNTTAMPQHKKTKKHSQKMTNKGNTLTNMEQLRTNTGTHRNNWVEERETQCDGPLQRYSSICVPTNSMLFVFFSVQILINLKSGG